MSTSNLLYVELGGFPWVVKDLILDHLYDEERPWDSNFYLCALFFLWPEMSKAIVRRYYKHVLIGCGALSNATVPLLLHLIEWDYAAARSSSSTFLDINQYPRSLTINDSLDGLGRFHFDVMPDASEFWSLLEASTLHLESFTLNECVFSTSQFLWLLRTLLRPLLPGVSLRQLEVTKCCFVNSVRSSDPSIYLSTGFVTGMRDTSQKWKVETLIVSPLCAESALFSLCSMNAKVSALTIKDISLIKPQELGCLNAVLRVSKPATLHLQVDTRIYGAFLDNAPF
ncbi:hypothetical protein BDZ89DRAFT_1172866 [Hymenopellis radicata]|nr:hypothetical protein BDZ89DRAFT_1172866 [Hymenopellis radicata]